MLKNLITPYIKIARKSSENIDNQKFSIIFTQSLLIMIFFFTALKFLFPKETIIKMREDYLLWTLLIGGIIGILSFFLSKLISYRLTILKNLGGCANLLRITRFLYSNKVKKEIFEPILSDWQEEYFEALFKKEIWKARWINVRYTYAFLAAMWQKSPIGDLIEFVIKIAKQ